MSWIWLLPSLCNCAYVSMGFWVLGEARRLQGAQIIHRIVYI